MFAGFFDHVEEARNNQIQAVQQNDLLHISSLVYQYISTGATVCCTCHAGRITLFNIFPSVCHSCPTDIKVGLQLGN